MRKTEEILRSLLHQKGMDSQEDISEFFVRQTTEDL